MELEGTKPRGRPTKTWWDGVKEDMKRFGLSREDSLRENRRRRRFWHATLRLRSAIRRHHPPQRAVLSQICCFGERKVVLFQILLDGAEPRTRGRPGCLLQSAGGEANRVLLASALSSMRIICPNRAFSDVFRENEEGKLRKHPANRASAGK